MESDCVNSIAHNTQEIINNTEVNDFMMTSSKVNEIT